MRVIVNLRAPRATDFHVNAARNKLPFGAPGGRAPVSAWVKSGHVCRKKQCRGLFAKSPSCFNPKRTCAVQERMCAKGQKRQRPRKNQSAHGTKTVDASNVSKSPVTD